MPMYLKFTPFARLTNDSSPIAVIHSLSALRAPLTPIYPAFGSNSTSALVWSALRDRN